MTATTNQGTSLLEAGRDLGVSLGTLDLIKENTYSWIFQASSDGKPLILKKYKEQGKDLLRGDVEGLGLYRDIAASRPDLIDSGIVKLNEEKRLLLIPYIHGESLRDLILRGRRDDAIRKHSLKILRSLGRLLREMYERTYTPGEETDEFIYRYHRYCSRRLKDHPLLGRLLFGGYLRQAEAQVAAFAAAKVAPSFAHGDFVPVNIFVDGDRVGLIDFANANTRSHLLNDRYGMKFALGGMRISKGYRRDLLSALGEGIGDLEFPPITHEFYREYHRRRWLMLKVCSRSPRAWVEATRGVVGFARRPGNEGSATSAVPEAG